MKNTLIPLLTFLLISACSQADLVQFEPRFKDEGRVIPVAYSDMKVISRSSGGKNTRIDCKFDNGTTILSFKTPVLFKMPIYKESAGRDVVITCAFNTREITMVANSQLGGGTTQTAVAQTTASGSIIPSSSTFGGGTGGALAIGLTTNPAASGFYIYPTLVSVDF